MISSVTFTAKCRREEKKEERKQRKWSRLRFVLSYSKFILSIATSKRETLKNKQGSREKYSKDQLKRGK